MLKWLNLKNLMNHFIQCKWFGKLCSMVSFTIHFKTRILLYGWGEFLTCPISYVRVLKLQWIRPNKIWALDEVKLWLFLWKFQMTGNRHHTTKYGHLVQWHCDFSGSFKRLVIIINRNIWNQHVLCVWDGYRFRLKISAVLSSMANVVL